VDETDLIRIHKESRQKQATISVKPWDLHHTKLPASSVFCFTGNPEPAICGCDTAQRWEMPPTSISVQPRPTSAAQTPQPGGSRLQREGDRRSIISREIRRGWEQNYFPPWQGAHSRLQEQKASVMCTALAAQRSSCLSCPLSVLLICKRRCLGEQ